MGLPDNVQNNYPNNPVPVGIKIGGHHVDGISDSQFTNPGPGEIERNGVKTDLVGDIV